jgi:hypothetical protein
MIGGIKPKIVLARNNVPSCRGEIYFAESCLKGPT